MRVALALPTKQKFAQDQFHETPQCGIGYIAGGLKKFGAEVTVINSKFQNIFEESQLINILLKDDFDIIGFSAMTFEINSVGRIAKALKSAGSKSLIAIGGCHVNAIPRQTMEEFKDFDIAFIGEHEDQVGEIFVSLLDRDYVRLGKFENIIYRKQGDLFYKDLNRRFISDVNKIPWPAYELFGSKNINPAYVSARGCPFGCFFASRILDRL